jgi:hypothetical protein
VSFGIFKFIVLPYVSELIEIWKSRRVMKDGTKKNLWSIPYPNCPHQNQLLWKFQTSRELQVLS